MRSKKKNKDSKKADKIVHPKKAAMLQALEKTLGVVTTAADKAGIGRQTHYDWMESDPAYKRAVESLADVALDFAESQLFKQVKEGNVASTIFYLKTKGKGRGYIERFETEDKTPEPRRLVLVEKK